MKIIIYITGDIHGTISVGERFNTKNFPEQKQMTKDDYVIITGDFGLIWFLDKEDQYWLNWLDETKPFTTLFVDGNHENFDLLNNFPIEEWNGGKIHRINDSVIHLMRGQVFTIKGKTFFTFGGAKSHDKQYRVEGISWWKQEMPDRKEFSEGLNNLEKHNWKVDYVITHTCSSSTLINLSNKLNFPYEIDELNEYFSLLEERLTYKKWYFGHFHSDIELPNNQELIYENRILLKLED